MSHAAFSQPLGVTCRHCVHYGGTAWGDPVLVKCNRHIERDGRSRVQPSGEGGCAFWMRETGSDDDLEIWLDAPLNT